MEPIVLLHGWPDSWFSFSRVLPLRIYQDTGHCPNWERPEQVAADLQAFLQRPRS